MTDSESWASVKKLMLSAFSKACEILIGIKLNSIGCSMSSIVLHDACVHPVQILGIPDDLKHIQSCECLAPIRSARD